jgi:hypothetical protein
MSCCVKKLLAGFLFFISSLSAMDSSRVFLPKGSLSSAGCKKLLLQLFARERIEHNGHSSTHSLIVDFIKKHNTRENVSMVISEIQVQQNPPLYANIQIELNSTDLEDLTRSFEACSTQEGR